MPKPLLLSRSSGLYVRFLVPKDLQSLVGSRFLVRPLHQPFGDGARLAAACMGVALSHVFRNLKERHSSERQRDVHLKDREQGIRVDIKKALDAAKDRVDILLGAVELPNGVVLRDVRVDTLEDERQLKSLMKASSSGAARPKPLTTAYAKPKSSLDDLLSRQMLIHLADLGRAGRDGKTVLESRHTLTLFKGVIGDKQVLEITGDDCRLFFDEVAYWPRHATLRAEYAGLSVQDTLIKAKLLGEPKPSQATLNKHSQRLSAFFNWLLKNKCITHNPLLGLVKQKKEDVEEETGRPFTQSELDAVFDPTVFKAWAKDHPHRWWVPMLGLFSGARVNELSQLYVADIETVQGVVGYHISKRFTGQKIKNPASRRFVPIAKPLLNAGFLEYVSDVQKAGHERLFPHLPNNDGNGFGKQMTKQFCTYIKNRGVMDEGMGMHAFRHTLATRLDRAGVSESTIAKITGHKANGGTLPKFYIDAPTLPERVKALAKFQSNVVLPIYQTGQFNEALKDAFDLPAKWALDKDKRRRKAEGKSKPSL